jgi:hypothetical protein
VTTPSGEGRRRHSLVERRAVASVVATGSFQSQVDVPGVPLKGKLFLSLMLLAVPLAASADQLVSAGSVITCTVAEGKISSQTQAIGDPVMCQLGHSEMYGRNTFPYGSYLIGHFAEYKDPGHFVGKGWMELKFDRLVVQPDTTVPIQARVVQTPKYPVDKDGRIHGTGHPVKDTVEWLIPVLWPLDLINLPRRGPRPVLAPETKLTLKVLDDFGIPTPMENAVRTPALVSRQTSDEPTYQQFRPAPIEHNYAPAPQQQAYTQPAPQPVQQAYAPPPQTVIYQYMQQPAPQPQQVIVQQQQPVAYPYPVAVPAPPVYYYRPRFYGPYGPY